MNEPDLPGTVLGPENTPGCQARPRFSLLFALLVSWTLIKDSHVNM